MVVTGFEKIEKEIIGGLHFPTEDVLTDKDQIIQRQNNLNNALTLGNLEHSKIRIYFEDNSGCKMVETTVWGLTDKRVILKHGYGIPINRIHSVQI